MHLLGELKNRNQRDREDVDSMRMTLGGRKEALHKIREKLDKSEEHMAEMFAEEAVLQKRVERQKRKLEKLATTQKDEQAYFQQEWDARMKELALTHKQSKMHETRQKFREHRLHATKYRNLRNSKMSVDIHAREESRRLRVAGQGIRAYQEAFVIITRETGIESLEELVDTFASVPTHGNTL